MPDTLFNSTFDRIEEIHKDLFRIKGHEIVKGLLDSVRPEVYFPGFPTLRFLPHTVSIPSKCPLPLK